MHSHTLLVWMCMGIFDFVQFLWVWVLPIPISILIPYPCTSKSKADSANESVSSGLGIGHSERAAAVALGKKFDKFEISNNQIYYKTKFHDTIVL